MDGRAGGTEGEGTRGKEERETRARKRGEPLLTCAPRPIFPPSAPCITLPSVSQSAVFFFFPSISSNVTGSRWRFLPCFLSPGGELLCILDCFLLLVVLTRTAVSGQAGEARMGWYW